MAAVPNLNNGFFSSIPGSYIGFFEQFFREPTMGNNIG
jgi:hypothetical protein